MMSSNPVEEPAYVLGHDSSNALVLPGSKKRKKRTEGEEKSSSKLQKASSNRTLARNKTKSKKQLKKISLIKERRAKKASRDAILEELSKFQVSKEELQQLSSVTALTRKPKKLNSISGSNKGLTKSKDVQRQWHTGPHYETDSESSHDETGPVNSAAETAAKKTPMDHVSSDDDIEQVFSHVVNNNKTAVKMEPEIEDTNKTDQVQNAQVDKSADHAEHCSSLAGATADKSVAQSAVNVAVLRTEEVQKERMKLPIFAEEQVIVEAIKENPVVIVCGETGSGKTTQVPQFLYEAGYAENGKLIGITEPRRVAAISMSTRVATELNLDTKIVSYQIRYEGNAGADTRIKFMTDGVMLKELQKDIKLSRYSVIIIDEAHERSMYSDILIGLLSRIAPMRCRTGDPLKLIVMSATLRVEDFTAPTLFRVEPRVLKVDSRQYPVTIYFNRRTPGDLYLQEAFKKVCKIHRLLPEGGILVFVSGQREVLTLISWLRKAFPLGGKNSGVSAQSKRDLKRAQRKQQKRNKKLKKSAKVDLDSYQMAPSAADDDDRSTMPTKGPEQAYTKADDLDEMGAADDLEIFEEDPLDNEMDAEFLEEDADPAEPLFCLPMYSLLPTSKQSRVFDQPPANCRLCVVATNVAETSLTIPNIKYVVDTGKEKVRLYDPVTGVSKFVVQWVSKASADQRAGRAGRIGPGHCYRLFSSAVFNDDFAQFSTADILNKPVDELVLQMKQMNIIKVNNFPFPSAPPPHSIQAAEQRLCKLGCLEVSKQDQEARITPLGRTVNLFPVKPQFGKILALCNQQDLLPYAVCLVAVLSVREPLVNLSAASQVMSKDQLAQLLRVRKRFADRGESLLLGDLSVLLKSVGAGEFEGFSDEFCATHGLRPKAVNEIRKLRKQLTDLINLSCDLNTQSPLTLDTTLAPPSEVQCKLLRQIVLSGLAENVAKSVPADSEGKRLKAAYETQTMKDLVYLHPSSVLYKTNPEYIVYQEIIETESGKKYAQTVCAVEAEWLSRYAAPYCTFGKPSTEATPDYCAEKDSMAVRVPCTFGPRGWKLSNAQVDAPHEMDKFRYFAVALLDGRVLSKFIEYRRYLLASPTTVTKSWAHLQPRITKLVDALVAKSVDNKKTLLELWQSDGAFLQKEFADWLPESKHSQLQADWPLIDD